MRLCVKIGMVMLVVCVMSGCAISTRPVPAHVDTRQTPECDVVQLRCATLPGVLRVLAIHYWFVAFDAKKSEWQRWEVWRFAGVSPTSWGHVQLNFMHPDSGVGGGPFRVVREWRGETARRLIDVLQKPEEYPDRETYRAWPGPNSNTYAVRVLRKAGVPLDTDPMAIGKDYRGIVGAGISPTNTGVQLGTPLIGLKLGLSDGVEVHALCLTFGLDLWPPAIKTPFGRVGWEEPSSADDAAVLSR
jgi:hypothetical protein